MAIMLEIRSDKKNGNRTLINGYLWTRESDPTWMRYQVEPETGVMQGIHVSRCNGVIPRATPFVYNFETADAADSFHEHVAMGILAEIGRETMISSRKKAKIENMTGKINAWKDFRTTLGKTRNITDSGIAESERIITHDRDLSNCMNLLNTGIRGELSLVRNGNFRAGARMSGFDAFRIATAGNFPPDLEIGDTGNPDIEQARIALAHVTRPGSHAVSWYGTRDADLAKYRTQAAQALPILAEIIAERPSLARAVDGMQALAPVLMTMTGLGKAAVRRIGRLTEAPPADRVFEAGEQITGEDALGVNRARDIRVSGAVPIDTALRHLAELPPDRTPNDNENWLKFNDILASIAIPLYNATSIPVATVLEASRGNWIQYHKSLARAADIEPENFDRRTMALTIIDALEALEHFNRTVLLPQALASIRDTGEQDPMVSGSFISLGLEATTELITGKSKNVAVLMMEISRRYASRIPAMKAIENRSELSDVERTNARFDAYGNDSWPTLTTEFNTSNGRLIRPLRNAAELLDEGSPEKLRHCIGNYDTQARLMNSHIFSIRSPDGRESYSTFELSGIGSGDARAAAARMTRRQHSGYRNSKPSMQCVQAYKEFRDAMKNGLVRINIDEIREWCSWMNSHGYKTGISTSWRSALELDWENDEIRLEYWKEWGNVLGGRIAGSPHPEVIFSNLKSRELVATMSPRAAMIMIEGKHSENRDQENIEGEVLQDGPQP